MQNSIIRRTVLRSAFLTVTFLVFSLEVSCQFFKAPQYNVEAGGLVSFGRQAPFWLVSNQFGKYSSNLSSGFLTAGIHSGAVADNKIGLGYGLEISDRLDSKNKLYIQQANLSLKLWFMHLRLGSKEESYGNQDTCLSSGSLMWSRNTRPMPKLLISTNGYVDVPFTLGYMQLSGLLSHGWFGDNGYVKNAYLHHKNVSVKAGGRLPVNVSVGLQHYAIWAGVSPDTLIGKLPSDFRAFSRMFFSRHGTSDSIGIPQNEAINRIGNHLGSWNYSLDIKLDRFLFGIYYQTIFEDYSGFSKMFMRDGLWGIYFKDKEKRTLVHEFLYEYVHTSYQSGAMPDIWTNETMGNDNYFNNSIYLSGWTYKGNIIGTPLISSPGLLKSESLSVLNNRVNAHHFGLRGEINSGLQYRILLTFSKNLGSYTIPFSKTQKVQSVLLEFRKSLKKFKGIDLNIRTGLDHGELYGNNAGLMLSLRKTGNLF